MGMVVLMVFIGGVTRLTESGLSIVEWKLVTGIFPPMTQEGWEAELEEYRASPEYQQVNRGMNVSEFKQIYWLEWLHRLLGRMTGLVFVLPLIYFVARKQLSPYLTKRMFIASLLVGAQGTLGWLMVYSGLQDDPRVSPLRLAAHLSLAFTLFCYLYWIWLTATGVARLGPSPVPAGHPWTRKIAPAGSIFCAPSPKERDITRASEASASLSSGERARVRGSVAIRLVTTLLFIQIIFGAFVAGMDAGLIYNTWPLMDGDFVPSGLMPLEPWHRNLVEYIPMVQWQHRTFAYVVAAAILGFVLWQWKSGPKTILANYGAVLVAQFLLGIFTIIYVVPISLASAHQLVALALLAASVRLCYAYPLKKA